MTEKPTPLHASQVTLETEFSDAIRLNFEEGRPLLIHLQEVLQDLGIDADYVETEEDLVLLYRCTVLDAFQLQYDRRVPGELLNALVRQYPWLNAERRRLSARLAALRAQANSGALQRARAGATSRLSARQHAQLH
jgi:hypothetical protein